MKQTLPIFILLALFGLQSCKQTTTAKSPEPIRTVDAEGLNIPVYNENGLDYYLNKKDDKIHIVNFWATWCAPCVKELPYFEQINEEFKDDGVEVTLVSLDFEHQLDTKLVSFVKENLKSKVVVVLPESEQAMIEKVSKNWQTGAIPATLIYNNDKRYFIEGQTNYEELKQQIENFR